MFFFYFKENMKEKKKRLGRKAIIVNKQTNC